MADWPPKKNAAFTWFFFIRDADGDPVAGATALDVEVSGDGAVFADVAGTEVDEGEGLYSCPITAAEMNFDVVALVCKTSTAGAKTAAQVVYTATRQLVDLAFPTSSGNSIDVTATGAVGIDWGNVENPTTALDLSGTDIQLVDTCTTNTDVRGTDSALLASSAPTNFGDLSITVTTGLVDITQAAADKAWSTATRVLTAAGIPSGGIVAAELNNIADALLDRRLDLGTDTGGNTTTSRTWRQALRTARNRVAISGGTMTVFEEDDVTSDFTAVVTTTAGDPITELNPA